MAAGLATLEIISQPGFYEPVFERTTQLCAGLRSLANAAGVSFTTNHAGSMFGVFFTGEPEITSYTQVMSCDTQAFNRFFHLMLENGVYLAPASYEAGFMSSAHSEDDIAQTIEKAKTVFAGL
jgi:glutamate-1-semialdehyde 2,1-aminomutase